MVRMELLRKWCMVAECSRLVTRKRALAVGAPVDHQGMTAPVLPRVATRRDGGRARRAVAVVVAWAAVVALTPAVAYGVWTPAGLEGDQGLEITGSDLVGMPLYPGSVGDVAFTVRNRDPHPVRVDTARLTGVERTSRRGCGAEHFTVQTGTVAPTVIEGGGSATVVVVGGLAMSRSAPQACQGVTISVSGRLSGSGA